VPRYLTFEIDERLDARGEFRDGGAVLFKAAERVYGLVKASLGSGRHPRWRRFGTRSNTWSAIG
jgi:hypothetical protein